MNRGHLSEYFDGVAVKTLSVVDATPSRSNQHEVGTTSAMRRFLGEHRRRFEVTYLWLGGEQDSFSGQGWGTHYDTRENQAHRRPEWRLYYPANEVTHAMQAGDTLFIAKRPGEHLLFIVTPSGSSIQNQLLWLFGFDGQPELRFAAQEFTGSADAELDFTARLILDEIGIEFEDPNANSLDTIIEPFGTKFPTTREFSDRARLTLQGVDPLGGPDSALMAWLNHEEAMFRRLERRILADRLSAGFGTGDNVDIDGFIQFSLQVQNRRKSRMGRAFENHLEAIFRAHQLRFECQVTTESGNKADFLFPSSAAYHDPDFPNDRLLLLAAKSTCKDRWRQVLPEAHRIWPKHLVTVEPAISTAQTDQMRSERVQLVLPASLHGSYKPEQRVWLMTIASFVATAKELEASEGQATLL